MRSIRSVIAGVVLAGAVFGAAWSQELPSGPRTPPPPPTELDARIIAQLQAGVSVSAEPVRSGGRVVGCAVNFLGVTQDHTYRRGGIVGLTGSVTIFARPPDQLFWAIKIVPSDLTLTRDGQIDWRGFTPSAGWIRVGPFASSQHEHIPFECESGGVCASGVGGLLQLMEALPMSRMEVGMQRRRGGLDFSWSVEPTRLLSAGANREAFPRCMIELLDSVGTR